MIEREKKFKVGERTFIVKFPNVGQIIDMESLKQALTNNRYGQMAASAVVSMYYALDLVDTIAFFQVCVPEAKRYFDVNDYTALSPERMDAFMEAYRTEIKPWYDRTMKELRGIKAEEEEKGDATEKDGAAHDAEK